MSYSAKIVWTLITRLSKAYSICCAIYKVFCNGTRKLMNIMLRRNPHRNWQQSARNKLTLSTFVFGGIRTACVVSSQHVSDMILCLHSPLVALFILVRTYPHNLNSMACCVAEVTLCLYWFSILEPF